MTADLGRGEVGPCAEVASINRGAPGGHDWREERSMIECYAIGNDGGWCYGMNRGTCRSSNPSGLNGDQLEPAECCNAV
jgi:hypothetical protein